MMSQLIEAQEKRSHLWERDELDWYVEPRRATEALLSVERFVGTVWDPCCGGGNIVRELVSAGYDAHGSDLVERISAPIPEWWRGTNDFRHQRGRSFFKNIVFNPPFFRAKGAEEFIRKALSLAEGKVAAFVDIRFLAGAERAKGLFAEHPPHRIWVITPRVSCPPGTYLAAGNKAVNGSSDWCWLVWDLTSPKPSASAFQWLRARPCDYPEVAA
jgi:hypothetical protein